MNEEDKLITSLQITKQTRKLVKKLRLLIHEKNNYWVSADRIIRGLVIQELELLESNDDITDIN